MEWKGGGEGGTVLVFEIKPIEDHASLKAFVILRRSYLTTIGH